VKFNFRRSINDESTLRDIRQASTAKSEHQLNSSVQRKVFDNQEQPDHQRLHCPRSTSRSRHLPTATELKKVYNNDFMEEPSANYQRPAPRVSYAEPLHTTSRRQLISYDTEFTEDDFDLYPRSTTRSRHYDSRMRHHPTSIQGRNVYYDTAYDQRRLPEYSRSSSRTNRRPAATMDQQLYSDMDYIDNELPDYITCYPETQHRPRRYDQRSPARHYWTTEESGSECDHLEQRQCSRRQKCHRMDSDYATDYLHQRRPASH